MFKPVEMVKISIVGSKDHFEKTAEVLHKLNLLHIEDFAEEGEYFRIGEPLSRASKASKFLVTLRSMLSYIKVDPAYEPKRVYSISELDSVLEKKVSELESEITARLEEIRKAEEQIRKLEDEKKVLAPLKALNIPVNLLKGYKNLKVFVGYFTANPMEKIMEVTKEFEIIFSEYEKEFVGAIFVKNEHAQDVFKVIQEFGYREIPVPDFEGSYDERLSEIERETSELKSKIKSLRTEMESLEKENLDLMLAMEEHLTIELEKSELPLRAAVSKYAFVLAGYVPKEKFDLVKNEVTSATNGKVVVEKLDDELKPPTALKNPRFAKPFELLTMTYTTPKYHEVDPTTLMAIVFPLMFGFMLGDIGYGICILALCLWLKKKFRTPGWQDLFNILIYSSVSTIVFGFIYGELFGFELFGHESFLAEITHNEAFVHFPHVNRLELAPAILVLTIAIGVIHMAIGYIFGILNVAKEHGWKHAVYEKLNWLLALISIAFIIMGFIINQMSGAFAFAPNFAYYIAAPLIIIWAALTIMGEGAMFLIEYLTLLSNTISYARLLAVGLASVGFAIAFNYMVLEMLFPAGIVGIIAGIIVFLLGHFINLLLGVLDPGLQSLRLHYVEHFVKFFEGGGIKYNPFGKIRKFTKEE
ncbi:Archaeal/vacuolar-type H+-ATPase subunit I [Archaeoglobus sulfaticallidus PM70-1]|uniref:A-type ATP synthase subunit I n=1 Tax=Archaeoglobus sulfaticallidus PM70-1 TaxID=387631 RepID=N0BND0_9EURY|nr:V-type ATP synthase subunit I [Archaeoglobus sulfaticallidus]AGK62151.1 Archaeal/vacuolar-type H+-ATPase subunit I [Archaeoglobus sulfaticallidus PM70-1]